jgi:hypothetical protein
MRFFLIAWMLSIGWVGLYVLARELARPPLYVATLDRVAALKSPKSSEVISHARSSSDKESSVTPEATSVGSPWVKVLLTARLHQGPSVETPIIGIQTSGARLYVIDNQHRWFQVINSDTGASGWIFWKYLGGIHDSEKMQIASTVPSSNETSLGKSSFPTTDDAAVEPRSSRSSANAKRFARVKATKARGPTRQRSARTGQSKQAYPRHRSHSELASLLDRAFSGY